MNTNPRAIRILCYGDSNVWGRSGKETTRYSANIRWTSTLQEKLGSDFEVIEEGLRSRTTNLDDDDPQFPGRNGLTYLRPCLESQGPLDLVVLWLGTNDLKTKFNRSASDVALALEDLISVIKPIPVLLVSPPLIKEHVLKPKSQFIGAGEKSRELAPELGKLAQKTGSDFLDMSQLVQPGDFDGVHLEPESHPIVAQAIYEKILAMELMK